MLKPKRGSSDQRSGGNISDADVMHGRSKTCSSRCLAMEAVRLERRCKAEARHRQTDAKTLRCRCQRLRGQAKSRKAWPTPRTSVRSIGRSAGHQSTPRRKIAQSTSFAAKSERSGSGATWRWDASQPTQRRFGAEVEAEVNRRRIDAYAAMQTTARRFVAQRKPFVVG